MGANPTGPTREDVMGQEVANALGRFLRKDGIEGLVRIIEENRAKRERILATLGPEDREEFLANEKLFNRLCEHSPAMGNEGPLKRRRGKG